MADNLGTDGIVFESSFDNQKFLQGIDQMVAGIDELTQKQQDLEASLNQVGVELSKNVSSMKANQQAMSALDRTSTTYQQDLQRLTAQEQQLVQQNTALTAQYRQQKVELTQTQAAADNYKNTIQGLVGTVKNVESQLKGKSIFDVANMNEQVAQVIAAGQRLEEVLGAKIDPAELEQFQQVLQGAEGDFEQLAAAIEFAASKLPLLEEGTQEFQDLENLVNTGRAVLEQYGQVVDETTEKAVPLSRQLRIIREELQRMEEAGEGNTQRFEELSIEAARLQDQIGDVQDRIRVLASDTKNLDFAIASLRGLAAGFQTVAGAAALFGLNSERAEEVTKQLVAIMSVLNGIQEITNLLKKDSVIAIVGETIATKAAAAAQAIYTAAVGATTGALRILRIALLATGIGAIIVGIGALVTAIIAWTSATEDQTEAQKLLNVAMETGIEINNLFIEGIQDAARVLLAQASLRQELSERLIETDQQAARRRIQANEENRGIEARNLQAQIDQAIAFENAQQAQYDRSYDRLRAALAGQIKLREEEVTELQKTVDNFNKIQETRFGLESRMELLRLNQERDRVRERRDLRRLELRQYEDFLKRLEELRKRLLDAQNAAARQDEDQLRKTAQDNLQAELNAIDKEVRQGKLTGNQGNLLKNLLRQINDVELTEELDEFRRKTVDAQQAIEDEIFNLRLENGQRRAELLRDQLEREAAIIQVESRKQFEELENARRQALDENDQAFRDGLISEGQAERNAVRIREIYEQLFLTLAQETTRRQEELAVLAFERGQQLVKDLFQPSFVILSEAATAQIQKITETFVRGRISYERYQKEITRITAAESQKRIELQITETNQLLQGVEMRLKAEQDPQRRAELQREVLRLREQIAQLRRQLAEGEAQETQRGRQEFDEKVQRIADYAAAVGSLVQSVVSFWAMANEAEQRSLDRSIALQEKRVEAATRIAERGNAEYLRMEEDRLNALRVQQENAARRQLAINAILQASQALVAFTGAIAQASATGGVLGAIAAAGAIVALLASGFAIVQQLQPETQELKEGTTFVKRGRAPKGDDTIPAMLNEGEAVIPTDRNQEYNDAVKAIYNKSIPAEDMNAFVRNFKQRDNAVPRVDYDAIGDAAQTAIAYDGRLVGIMEQQGKKLDEANEELRMMRKQLKHLGVNVNVDKNGLAISVLQAVEQSKKDKRS